MTHVLVPGAEPRWAAEAVEDADIVVLLIPLHKFAGATVPANSPRVLRSQSGLWDTTQS